VPPANPAKTGIDIPQLVDRARQGDPRAVARLISLVEDGSPRLRELLAALGPYAGSAYVVGLTGSPGVGKSTSTNALVSEYRALGKRVGVLAVDPSSPFSGGALLGDRVRMQDHATDPGSSSARWPRAATSAACPRPPRRPRGCWRRPAAT
jgi:LAO/AO transport system kinase